MIFDENYTIPKMFKDTAEKYPEIVAQYKRISGGEFEPILYREMYQLGLDFGAALLSIGIKREDKSVSFPITAQNGCRPT